MIKKKKVTLYVTSNSKYCIGIAGGTENANLGNCRLHHISENEMKECPRKESCPTWNQLMLAYEDCFFEKHKRVSFSNPEDAKAELVHNYLWGPTPVTSLGGLHTIWPLWFHKKDMSLFFLRINLICLVFSKVESSENEIWLKVKCLRSENGEKYEFREFKD